MRMRNGKYGLALCAVLLAAPGLAHEAPGVPKKAAKIPSLPARKSGLWEVTLRSDDLVLKRPGQAAPRPQTVQQCTSAEAESTMLLSILPGQEDCHEVKAQRRAKSAGEGYDITTLCYVHGNRVDAQMELRGDLQAAYSGTYDVKYAQTPMHNTGRRLFEGRWLGACKPGQRPGDMVLPNGITVNVLDDNKRAEAHGREAHDHAH